MKHFSILTLFVVCLNVVFGQANVGNMVCFYDSTSLLREGSARMTVDDLSPALHFCNYLVYGYAGIDPHSYKLKPLNSNVDIQVDHYRVITGLKRRYPNLRILLSVGGDKDIGSELPEENNKYLELLEHNTRREAFVSSAVAAMEIYGFDGLDLAWQFPKNPPVEIVGGLRAAWRTFKGWFRAPRPVDERADDHKIQFTSLVRELNAAFRRSSLILTLTMLPHVNPELFIDVFVVMANVDFVNLCTFDFHTPTRDPKQADYPAALYELYERDPDDNVNYQVDYWLNKTTPANLINIGVPAYGLAWKMSLKSGITGYPPISKTLGVAAYGNETTIGGSHLGVLSWPVICEKLLAEAHNGTERLRKVGDPTHRYGNYAYRAATENELTEETAYGMWVGYDGPDVAAIKAGYVSARGLGGVALFDLSLDDFRGRCAGEKFPILRSIKHRL